jgi:hypothetical protein
MHIQNKCFSSYTIQVKNQSLRYFTIHLFYNQSEIFNWRSKIIKLIESENFKFPMSWRKGIWLITVKKTLTFLSLFRNYLSLYDSIQIWIPFFY